MATSNTGMKGWGWEETGPIWGARAFAPKSGQDHLGLGSVSSDRILPSLSPGSNVLTIHPRYWSFYSEDLAQISGPVSRWPRDFGRGAEPWSWSRRPGGDTRTRVVVHQRNGHNQDHPTLTTRVGRRPQRHLADVWTRHSRERTRCSTSTRQPSA